MICPSLQVAAPKLILGRLFFIRGYKVQDVFGNMIKRDNMEFNTVLLDRDTNEVHVLHKKKLIIFYICTKLFGFAFTSLLSEASGLPCVLVRCFSQDFMNYLLSTLLPFRSFHSFLFHLASPSSPWIRGN